MKDCKKKKTSIGFIRNTEVSLTLRTKLTHLYMVPARHSCRRAVCGKQNKFVDWLLF